MPNDLLMDNVHNFPKKSVETSAGLIFPVNEIMNCDGKNQIPLMAVVDKAEDKEMDQIDNSYYQCL